MAPLINQKPKATDVQHTIVLEHMATTSPSTFGGPVVERSVTVPLQLAKLRECIHPNESVATAAFEMPPCLNDQGWQWQLRVFPHGQLNSAGKLVVYLVLTGIGANDEETSTAADAAASYEAQQDAPMRLERQSLDVCVRLVYTDRHQNRPVIIERPQLSHMFDWAKKPTRWTRHEFDLKKLKNCKKVELVCELRAPKRWTPHETVELVRESRDQNGM